MRCISIFFVTVIPRCNLLPWYFVCAVVLLLIVLCLYFYPYLCAVVVVCVVCVDLCIPSPPPVPPLVAITPYTYIYIIIPILPERWTNERATSERVPEQSPNEINLRYNCLQTLIWTVLKKTNVKNDVKTKENHQNICLIDLFALYLHRHSERTTPHATCG